MTVRHPQTTEIRFCGIEIGVGVGQPANLVSRI